MKIIKTSKHKKGHVVFQKPNLNFLFLSFEEKVLTLYAQLNKGEMLFVTREWVGPNLNCFGL